MPRESRMRLESGKRSAAQRKKGGGGDVAGDGGVDGFQRSDPPGMLSLSPAARFRVAPKARRACSEWSRVRTDSESDWLCRSACRPAKRNGGLHLSRRDRECRSRWRGAGRRGSVMGACPSTKFHARAHLAERGLRMRSIGRRVREWSPMRVKVCGCGAMRPESMRMVEPELPQSSGAAGCEKWPAVPVTSMTRVGAFASLRYGSRRELPCRPGRTRGRRRWRSSRGGWCLRRGRRAWRSGARWTCRQER